MHFPTSVNEASTHRKESRLPLNCVILDSIANRRLVTHFILVRRLLPIRLYVLGLGGVDGESSFCGASFGVDTTSDDLAVRVLRNPLAGGPCGSVVLGPGRRFTNVVRADAERPRDRRECWSDAGCRHALHSASCQPDVASGNSENAASFSSGPSPVGTV